MSLKNTIFVILVELFLVNIVMAHNGESPPIQSGTSSFTGETLSLNFEEIDIKAALGILADFTGLNMITSETVSGKITLHLQNVPWDEALEIILKTKGLAKKNIDNVLWITTTEEIIAREKWEWQAEQQQADLSSLQAEYFCINHAKAITLAALLKSDKNNFLSARGSVSVDERTNTLLVQDTKAKLAQIKTLIEQLDVPVKQVLIESRIVFMMDDIEKVLGITLSSPLQKSGVGRDNLTDNIESRSHIHLPVALSNGASNMARLGFTLAKLPGGILLDLELMALENEGLGKIISSPRLVTSNQQQAYIESGEEIPYQEITSSGATSIAFKKAVLRLEVTPQITLDDHVILDLKVNQDSRGVVTNGVPAINTREMQTKVLIADGETIVLGGIYQHHKTQNKTRVPFLGKLPLIGWLFRSSTRHLQKNALLIFVTPHILREEMVPSNP